MELPETCPVCTKDGEFEYREFDEKNSIVDENYYCAVCDAEWKVMYVLVEKTLTRSQRETC
jgi:hypothetical protein